VGSWTPPWSGGDAYPDVCQQANNEWAGVLTLSRLPQLQAFERLER
jgi:hypothetical protein